MKKIAITSPSFEGSIEISYHTNGFLVAVSLPLTLNDEQYKWILEHLPLQIDQLVAYRNNKKFNIVEQDYTFSFEQFYTTYGYKVGKEKAKMAWDKLSVTDRNAAYIYIARYKLFLQNNQGIAVLYPATYLNQKRWND